MSHFYTPWKRQKTYGMHALGDWESKGIKFGTIFFSNNSFYCYLIFVEYISGSFENLKSLIAAFLKSLPSPILQKKNKSEGIGLVPFEQWFNLCGQCFHEIWDKFSFSFFKLFNSLRVEEKSFWKDVILNKKRWHCNP